MSSYTIAEACDAVLSHYTNGWVTAGYDVKNILFDDVSDDLPGADQIWSRATYKLGGARKASLSGFSGAKYSRSATLIAQLFTPNNDGAQKSNILAQAMLDVFEGDNTDLGPLHFNESKLVTIGNDANWYQVNLVINVNFSQNK